MSTFPKNNRFHQKAAYIFVCGLTVLLTMNTTANTQSSEENDDKTPLTEIEGLTEGAQYCQIVLIQPGTLGASFDGKSMGSTEPGGTAGIAMLTATNSSYQIVLDTPTSFTRYPINGNDSVAFKTSYSGYGNTNFGQLPGNSPVKIKKGETRVEANIFARRSVGTFPSGEYSADLTLRCE